ncbi:MAG: hypothetical protein BWY82_01720 [Verrucomicrobia bacterium ADurb.Bin474]|nr:MAG: hypothetical protein BWY82_01720 [Verrucomicrobia bacterium ADurb.Bin474]
MATGYAVEEPVNRCRILRVISDDVVGWSLVYPGSGCIGAERIEFRLGYGEEVTVVGLAVESVKRNRNIGICRCGSWNKRVGRHIHDGKVGRLWLVIPVVGHRVIGAAPHREIIEP